MNKIEYQKEIFRYFFRKNYNEMEISNEECDLMGEQFYDYLNELNLTDEQKKNILPKNEIDIIMNSNHPLKMDGFPPAYFLHFTQFVKKQIETDGV